jgi:Tol biopolymer transport system component
MDAWRLARSRSGARDEGVAAASGDSVAGQAPGTVRRPPAVLAAVAVAVLVLLALTMIWRPFGTAREPDRVEPSLRNARPLANDPAPETSPSLSPDGREVVYVLASPGVGGLYVSPVSGGPPRRIPLGDVKLAGYPRWSPRGDLIAFLAFQGDSERAVHVIPAEGGPPRRVTSASGIGLCWSADGDSLGFVDGSVTGEPLSIFSISLTTGQRTRLSAPPRGSFGDTHCAFAPDGRLAVARYFTRSQSDVCVIRLDPEGGEVVERLTYDFDGIEGLAWTPDARHIVFGAHSGLWKVPASPDRLQPPERVTGDTETAYPTFSHPSGARPVRFAYNRTIIDVNLWRLDVRGDRAPPPEKVDGSAQWESHPAFSPEARRIAFASNRSGHNEIWTANPDGSDSRQLTFHRGPMVISPQWSPDGERLAYSAQLGGNRDIYVISLDGSRATRLTWEASQEENPAWSRDGRWVYFRSDRTGIGTIWKVPAAGGSAVRVTVGEGSEAFESPDGRLLYVVRSWEVPGVWSMPVNGGKETLLIPNVTQSFWGVSDTGIAFLVTSPRQSPGGPTIRWFDFESGQTSVVSQLAVPAREITTGFAVSQDGRSFMLTRRDRFERDVMLIDPWR